MQSHGYRLILSLQCYDECVYVVHEDSIGTAVNKCIVEQDGSLRAISRFRQNNRYLNQLARVLDIREGHLYFTIFDDICVVDSDTMTLQSTISPRHHAYNIAISRDDKLHVATCNGVHIYTTDGTPTGQSYLDRVECESITCTSDGYSIVGMEGKVAVVSSDLTAICILSVDVLNMYRVMCDRVDNSLVIMNSTGSSFAIVPQEVYRPPFSLFSLCMSTILLNADELPISLLPLRLHKLVKKYI